MRWNFTKDKVIATITLFGSDKTKIYLNNLFTAKFSAISQVIQGWKFITS